MGKISVFAAVLAVFAVSGVQADTGTNGEIPVLQVGETAHVQGLVHFEKRHTVVPLGYCEGFKPCPQSRPYWTVVMQNNETKFEIDQRFNEGDTREPESVQVAGVTVHSGAVLKLDATVEYASADYYIVGDVKNVNLVMEYLDPSAVSLPNWSCHGNLDRDIEIQVAVWYTGIRGTAPANRYGIRLVGSEESAEGHRTYALATLNEAQGRSDHGNLIYEGFDASSSVKLVIAQGTDGLERNVISKLSFSLSQLPAGNTRIPPQSELDVVCSKIR